jgi:hypothetical protein
MTDQPIVVTDSPAAPESRFDRLTEKTTIANIVAGVSFVVAVVYGAVTNNPQLLTNIGFLGAGYLFGVTDVTVSKKGDA